ncbi:MAG: hypothetical protein HY557_08825 [Euryarchaeota archaeon]|nr:hypothetical protein [Euryarchaeota archaeon]
MERGGKEAQALPERTGKPRGFWARVRGAFAAPELGPPPEPPESWVRRITDDQNLWLTAIQEQRQGDLGEASVRFLEDAHLEELRGHRARSGLSLAQAASVLREAGEEALSDVCYRAAAERFRLHAAEVVDRSPREALWSLERAATFYAFAQATEQLDEVRNKYAVLHVALHPDQADKLPQVFAKPPAAAPEVARAGGPLPKKGVKISREYAARLERLLERF